MTTETKAVEALVNKVLLAISKKIEKLPYDHTFPSVVYGKDEKGKYLIPYEGRLRGVQSALSDELPEGTWVWVKIPNGKLREMHICGLRHK